jgi:hypothetical protein
MILIPEKVSDNTFNFLESQIRISNNGMQATLYAKNWQSLMETGVPSIVNAQDFYSYTGDPNDKPVMRIASILGRLAAAEQFTFPEENLLISFVHIFTNLRSLRYPTKIIREAVFKKYHQSKNSMWLICAKLVSFLDQKYSN